MQRRVPDYAIMFSDFNMMSSIGAFGLGLMQLLFAWILIKVCILEKGEKATDQVWEGAEGLEFTHMPSPAPYHTFDTPPKID